MIRVKPKLTLVVFLLAAFFFIGCGAGSSKKASPEAVQLSPLDWNTKTLVTAYQEFGLTNALWDAPAIRALTEFARSRSQLAGPDEPVSEIIATNCDAAIESGCNDPMIRYLNIKFSMSQTNTPKAFSDAFNEVESNMQQSLYPPIRKFYASFRAFQQYTYTYGYGRKADMTIPKELLCDATSNLVAALNDPTTPPEEVYETCSQFLYAFPGDMKPFKAAYAEIEKPLFANWSDKGISWLLKGEAYNIMGAMARGSGYANTVTEDGWKGLAEDSAEAEKALNRAWELDPTNAQIAVTMIWVETGQGKGRDQMEMWFKRAMNDNPNDYDACSAKLNYIEPKWYGSTDDMLEFGRECVQNTNWGGAVPLILVDAHYSIYNQYIDPSDRTNYWKDPQVWEDISSAYERYLKNYPDDASRLAYYAGYAYHGDHWNKLNELLPKVSPDYYYLFGGTNEFNKIVQTAKTNVSSR